MHSHTAQKVPESLENKNRQNPTEDQHKSYCAIAKSVITLEAKVVSALAHRVDENFSTICAHLMHCKNRIILIGMGKSGHIARKIAATFASTGSPAFFIHPAEANHGDAGMITQNDMVIAISYSGETHEILQMLPILKRLQVPLIALTGAPTSTLAIHANHHLDISIEQEACPLGLAPTSSTTAALVMGDALALTLSKTRGFTSSDFALSHPGGSLGKRLLLRVSDIMQTGASMPIVSKTSTLKTALIEMSHKNLGFTLITDETTHKLLGIFTDGDLRRVLNQDLDISTTIIGHAMTSNCITVAPDMLVSKALKKMEGRSITALAVTNTALQPIGVLHLHDIIRTGIT